MELSGALSNPRLKVELKGFSHGVYEYRRL